MTDFRVGVVIPVGAGREQALSRVLDALEGQTFKPAATVLVYDGCAPSEARTDIFYTYPPKHEPGREQPRNIGVTTLRAVDNDLTHVWFLDTDVVPEPTCLEAFRNAGPFDPEPHILVGPYDWLQPGVAGLQPGTRNDYRWVSFDEHPPDEVCYHPIGAGLACLSGNLVWPIDEFQRVGGFWNELHHGRCEDGELGIRAVAAGVGVSFVRDARAYHQWHERDGVEIARRNAVDVPKINRRHPFMPDAASLGGNRGPHLLMTAKDGIRFDFRCPGCDERMNSLLFWEHCGGHDWECPNQ